ATPFRFAPLDNRCARIDVQVASISSRCRHAFDPVTASASAIIFASSFSAAALTCSLARPLNKAGASTHNPEHAHSAGLSGRYVVALRAKADVTYAPMTHLPIRSAAAGVTTAILLATAPLVVGQGTGAQPKWVTAWGTSQQGVG